MKLVESVRFDSIDTGQGLYIADYLGADVGELNCLFYRQFSKSYWITSSSGSGSQYYFFGSTLGNYLPLTLFSVDTETRPSRSVLLVTGFNICVSTALTVANPPFTTQIQCSMQNYGFCLNLGFGKASQVVWTSNQSTGNTQLGLYPLGLSGVVATHATLVLGCMNATAYGFRINASYYIITAL